MDAVKITATPKAKKIHQKSAWDLHVDSFRQAHPDMKFKEVLQTAKESYQKKGKVGKGSKVDVSCHGNPEDK